MTNDKFQNKIIEFTIISIALAFLIGWFFREAVFSGKIFVERDISRYYYPLRQFSVTCITSGIFPLWNPYIFCGNPLFASLQSCVLYPLSIIYYLGDFAKVFNAFVLLHFFLAAVFTYIFLRQMRYSAWAAILSAAAFALSGYMTSTVNLLTTLSVVSWLPLAMIFYYRMIKSAKRPGLPRCRARAGKAPWPAEIASQGRQSAKLNINAVILGVIFTVMFLGGEPSVLYATVGIFSMGVVYFTVEELVEKRHLTVSYTRKSPSAITLSDFQWLGKCFILSHIIKNMLLAIVVFAGLSAFQLLPFLEFLRTSSRDRVNFEMATIWNLPFRDLPGIIIPFFQDIFKMFINYWARQSWLDNYYVGILVFFLFVIGVLFDRSRKARAVLLFGLVGFALALGKNTILFEFLYRFLPGFKVMRYSIRFFFIPTFAISVLAGMGLDYYMKFSKTSPGLKRAAFFALALAFFSSIAFWCLHFNFQHYLDIAKSQATRLAWASSIARLYAEEAVKGELFLKFLSVDLMNLKRAFLLLVFFGSLFYMGTQDRVRIRIFIVPWLVFLAVSDIFAVNSGFNPVFDIKKFRSPTDNVKYLRKEQARLAIVYPGDFNKQLFRICCSPQTAREHAYVPEPDFYQGLEASKDRLITNRMIEFGIYDVNMYGSVYIRRNSRFMNLVMDKRSKNLEKLLKLCNVRFVASSREPKAVGFKLANRSEAANLYETKEYLPRAFLVPRAVVIKDEEKILAKLKEGDFEPEKEVILEEYISVPYSVQCTVNREQGREKSAVEKPKITSYTPNKVVIEAEVGTSPKFLLFTDTYYPGWKVFVDKDEQRLLRADYMFRGVYLGPGSHTVEFIYSPFTFKLGIFITLSAILIILTIIIYYIIIIRLKD